MYEGRRGGEGGGGKREGEEGRREDRESGDGIREGREEDMTLYKMRGKGEI